MISEVGREGFLPYSTLDTLTQAKQLAGIDLPACPSPQFLSLGEREFYALTKPYLRHSNADQQAQNRKNWNQDLVFIERDLSQLSPYILQALQQGNWNALKYLNPDLLVRYSLIALRRGNLTNAQFATITFFRSLVLDQQNPYAVEVVSLFDENKQINLKAFHTLVKTMRSNWEGETIELLTDLQLQQIIERLALAPSSERFFFIVEASESLPEEHLIEMLKDQAHFNLFKCVELEGKKYTIVPSFSLMQMSLQVKFQDQAAYLNPVLGLSDKVDIVANGILNTSDMALPYSGISFPPTIDGYICYPDTAVVQHDFYHAWIRSSIPLKLKHAYLFLSQEFEQLAVKVQDLKVKEDLNHLASLLTDMEVTVFRPEFKGPCHLEYTLDELFWYGLSEVFNNYFFLEKSESQAAEYTLRWKNLSANLDVQNCFKYLSLRADFLPIQSIDASLKAHYLRYHKEYTYESRDISFENWIKDKFLTDVFYSLLVLFKQTF